MARETEGFRAQLELICSTYKNDCLSVEQAAEFTGLSRERVCRDEPFRCFWVGKGKGKYITRTNLARALCV